MGVSAGSHLPSLQRLMSVCSVLQQGWCYITRFMRPLGRAFGHQGWLTWGQMHRRLMPGMALNAAGPSSWCLPVQLQGGEPNVEGSLMPALHNSCAPDGKESAVGQGEVC